MVQNNKRNTFLHCCQCIIRYGRKFAEYAKVSKQNNLFDVLQKTDNLRFRYVNMATNFACLRVRQTQ